MALLHSAKLAAMHLLERAPDSIGSISSVRDTRPVVVPTFDDGPTPSRTHDVLTALAQHQATATFFVLMTSVRANRGLLADVVAAGHEVGLHGVDHRHLSLLPGPVLRENMRAGKAELEDALGAPVRWFRPPYGDQDVAAWRAIRDAGMTSVLWSGTSWDWNPAVDNDARVTKATHGLKSGTILLFHDGFASTADLADDGPEPILDRHDLVSRILDVCDRRGMRARSLGDALDEGATAVTRPHYNIRRSFRRAG